MSDVSADMPFTGVDEAISTMGRLRDEESLPKVRLPSGDTAWFVGGYEETRAMLADRRFGRDLSNPSCPRMTKDGDFADNPGSMVSLDGADHLRRRKPVQQHLTPKRVEGYRATIESIATELVDDIVASGDRVFEFGDRFSYPFASRFMSRFLGIPDEYRDLFRSKGMPLAHADQHTEQQIAEAFVEINAIAEEIIAGKDPESDADMLSVLLGEQEKGNVSAWEVQVSVYELMFAGFLTTGSVLISCLYRLLSRDDVDEIFGPDPATLPAFIDEVVRLHPPTDTAFLRAATEDVCLRGQMIRRNEGIVGGLVSANRDPRVYAEPDEIRLGRSADKNVPKHLGYGHGAHHCVGASLARMQLEIALRTLHDAMPDLALAEPEAGVEWDHSLFERSIRRLDVRR